MGRKQKNTPPSLGQRLRELRKQRGFTQVELAKILGTSQRMIAYYEAQGGNVSADMMAKLADALDVSVDQLLNGQKSPSRKPQQPPNDLRLMRKLRLVERLPAKDRRSVLQIIDVLLERQALKQAHGS